MPRGAGFRTSLFSAAILAGLAPASAHHVMDGATPVTVLEGLLSGLGHPIIGLDHLAFLLAAGLAAGIAGLHPLTPAVFVAASLIGVLLHVREATLPGAEAAVAASVLFAGVALARGMRLPRAAWIAFFLLAGLVHGYAFGEAIVGAEPAPLGAYLVGLAIVQTAIATAVAIVVQGRALAPDSPVARLAGLAIAAVGLGVLAGQLVL